MKERQLPVSIVNSANHRLWNISGSSCNSKPPITQERKHKLLTPKFGESKPQRHSIPSQNVIQTVSRSARHFHAPPHDQRSAEWNEELEEFARHTAY